MLSNLCNSFIFYKLLTLEMLENIAYFGIGFVTSFLALEAAWHFTACKVHDKSIKPCMYKQVKLAGIMDI